MSTSNAKRTAEPDVAPSAKKRALKPDTSENGNTKFTEYSLKDIQKRFEGLCQRVPEIPEDEFGLAEATAAKDDSKLHEDAIREWAATLQAILEEFNLLVCCIATATYKWGTDRSGAADQNLSMLSAELSASQEQISSTVTPRLTNVLAPVVDLVIGKTVTIKNDAGEEIKENQFTRKLVDPSFLQLCHRILARNAPLLRQVVLSNFHKLVACLDDYLKAQQNDTQHSRGFTY